MTTEVEKLPRLIERAAAALANATTAAEILEARDHANIVYSAAKKAAQFARMKEAHDEVVAACHKAMADALVIEAQAQHRLADGYDAAQERGEVSKAGQPRKNIIPKVKNTSAENLGLTPKQVHEARLVRDAEKKKPGVVRQTLEAKLAAGEEPTRADVKRAVRATLQPPPSPAPERPYTEEIALVEEDEVEGEEEAEDDEEDEDEEVRKWFADYMRGLVRQVVAQRNALAAERDRLKAEVARLKAELAALKPPA